jgi:ADP-heptose:LPS heptosyltransferase
MRANDNILDLLREKGAEAARQMQRGLILQPGAIGDCILTLPLAAFMKESLRLGGIDILGHTEYMGILPGRTCVDGIRSIDAMDLHRLFIKTNKFELKDRDPLINVFADYAWIATFMGEPNSHFERNLIYTANCSHSAEVITLSMKPSKDFSGHISDFYIRQFINQCSSPLEPCAAKKNNRLLESTKADKRTGKELLKETGIDQDKELVVIQPGSGGKRKCWHIDNFLAVTEELISNNSEVVFLLGPAERERFSNATNKTINSLSRCLTDLSLSKVLELLSCTDIFIGNDSGITHLAAGLGTRTLVVFGPTNPDIYKPIGPDVTVFTANKTTFAKKTSSRMQRKLLKVLREL